MSGRPPQAIAPLAADHQLIMCHGNGPQIGILATESADDEELSRPFPLDVLGAQTQGMIGYWLAQELTNAGVRAPIAVVITRTLVDADDPAFAAPTKFIGRTYSAELAQRLARERGWSVAADGSTWRRVVAVARAARGDRTADHQPAARPRCAGRVRRRWRGAGGARRGRRCGASRRSSTRT